MSVTVRRKKVIKECDGGCTGGVSAPFNTLNNTGISTKPAQQAKPPRFKIRKKKK